MGGPSFGQKARGLVESLYIPAAEMAAVVVSGGLGNALGGKVNKNVDKATMLRGERCPRVILHLVILYLCKASLESASRCVQQFISLLPSLLTSDDDQEQEQLQQVFLLTVRSYYEVLDDGARFHVILHLILETVICGKSMLSTSILGRDDPYEGNSNKKEAGFILNLIQKDKVLTVVVDETKYMKKVKSDHMKQLQQLCVKLDEHSVEELNQLQSFEDEIRSYKVAFLSADDKRKASFQLAYDEDQQIVTNFEDRYRNFSDPDTPSFYFGSHYSSMGIHTAESALHRNLQGSKFDCAGWLFQSIDSTYRNCLSNTSDVKELIPEFFYMPDFLVNSNSYHLGIKQDGEPLGDVALPPWAQARAIICMAKREMEEMAKKEEDLHQEASPHPQPLPSLVLPQPINEGCFSMKRSLQSFLQKRKARTH